MELQKNIDKIKEAIRDYVYDVLEKRECTNIEYTFEYDGDDWQVVVSADTPYNGTDEVSIGCRDIDKFLDKIKEDIYYQ